MRSFHDLLEIRPYYWFKFFGWNLISHFPDVPENVMGFGAVKSAESMMSACWADQA
jgi:hypothetical protein